VIPSNFQTDRKKSQAHNGIIFILQATTAKKCSWLTEMGIREPKLTFQLFRRSLFYHSIHSAYADLATLVCGEKDEKYETNVCLNALTTGLGTAALTGLEI